MEVRVGLWEILLGETVEVAFEKQDAKKQLSRLAFPRDVDSD